MSSHRKKTTGGDTRPNLFRERFSIYEHKYPKRVVLGMILVINIVLVFGGAFIIHALAPDEIQAKGFWASVYYAVSMILDPGNMTMVVEDVGGASVALILICLAVIVLGMIFFTGAIIGYVTNFISEFIESANAGDRPLVISGHTIILNWNSRASEIVNDMLYSEHPEKIVFLVPSGRERVEQIIRDRIADTLDKERKQLEAQCRERHFGKIQSWDYIDRNLIRDRLTVIVREGETSSMQKLNDIAVKQAKSVIILGQDEQSSICAWETQQKASRHEKGNSELIKTLIQVAEMTGADDSWDNQKVIVEAEDSWTLSLVNKIIEHKERQGKCNIVALPVNLVLGQILSQFSIMPELNMVYDELFSNRGASFYNVPVPDDVDDDACCREHLSKSDQVIPLCSMNANADGAGGKLFYYMAKSEKDIEKSNAIAGLQDGPAAAGAAVPADSGRPFSPDPDSGTRNTDGDSALQASSTAANKGQAPSHPARKPETVSTMAASGFRLQPDFYLERRSIVVLGHSSKMGDIISGFNSFRDEWNFRSSELQEQFGTREVLDIMVIDTKENLEKFHFFEDLPYVNYVVSADVYDRDIIVDNINRFIDAHTTDTSILVLSDDTNTWEERDASVMTYLIYLKDIVNDRIKANPDFDRESIDIVYEIQDPRNYDVIRSYSSENVIISNRYISKMVTQISEKQSIYEFYKDILSYDPEQNSEEGDFSSKELYIKKVKRFFLDGQIPGPCTAAQLIRGVYEASDPADRQIVLGYVSPGQKMVLFSGSQSNIRVELKPEDKLVIFAGH